MKTIQLLLFTMTTQPLKTDLSTTFAEDNLSVTVYYIFTNINHLTYLMVEDVALSHTSEIDYNINN